MADVVIVGAGIIGSAIALELSHRGVRTHLLEKAVPGAESSSAAAGMLAPHLEAHAQPDPAYVLGVESLGIYEAWIRGIEELSGLDGGFRRDGAVTVREGSDFAWQIERGVAVEALDRQQLESLVPGIAPRFHRGSFVADEAQVDPPRLMRALTLATDRAKARRSSGVTVRRVHTNKVELDDHAIEADAVVVAAGAWTSLIPGVPLPKEAVVPARGQMLSLEAQRYGPYVWSDRAYLVPRPDGRMVVGATVERAGFDKSVTAGGVADLLAGAIEAIPDLATARLERTWAGLRPMTLHGHPIIGEVEGLFLATGHYRNGILHAPLTARIIADLITGETPSIDVGPFGWS